MRTLSLYLLQFLLKSIKKKNDSSIQLHDAFCSKPSTPPQQFLTAEFRDGPMLFEPLCHYLVFPLNQLLPTKPFILNYTSAFPSVIFQTCSTPSSQAIHCKYHFNE